MIKRIFTLFLTLNLIFLLSACTQSEIRRQLYVMDSVASLRLISARDSVADEMCSELYDIDRSLSVYDGVLSEINNNGGGELDRHSAAVLRRSLEFCEKTNGAFSPSLGTVIDLWGVGSKNYVPTDAEITAALERTDISSVILNDSSISLSNGVRLNLGAIAKGYASDVLRDMLIQNNIESAVISLGGNVYVHGEKPGAKKWNVAIRDPAGDENDWLGSISLTDMFVISSGDYERYFESGGKRYHHIIDPKTGSPAESDLTAVAVICEDGAMGDAYSTALYVMGRDAALSFWRAESGFELVLVEKNGIVTVTEGIADAFTPNKEKGYVYETAYR